MLVVTVVPILEPNPKSGTPLIRLMNDRLIKMASDLQAYLTKELLNTRDCEDLIIYISYNSKYAVRWKIVNDVTDYVQEKVVRKCGNLGYIEWRELDLYAFKSSSSYHG